jgi:hypothetical protein
MNQSPEYLYAVLINASAMVDRFIGAKSAVNVSSSRHIGALFATTVFFATMPILATFILTFFISWVLFVGAPARKVSCTKAAKCSNDGLGDTTSEEKMPHLLKNQLLVSPSSCGLNPGPDALSQPSTKKKYYICKFVKQKKTCPAGSTCKFAHHPSELPYYKTKLCKDYVQGKCPVGVFCQFAHGGDELKRHDDPPATKQELCQDYISKGICVDANCIHAHGEALLMSGMNSSRIVAPLSEGDLELLTRSGAKLVGTLRSDTGAQIDVDSDHLVKN